jgi:hypothetical protein
MARRARVARTRSTAIVAITNTVSARDSTATTDPTPARRSTTAATRPITTGHRKLRLRLSSERAAPGDERAHAHQEDQRQEQRNVDLVEETARRRSP